MDMDKLKIWLQSLTQQQRILMLILFAGVVYFIWSSTWENYYSSQRAIYIATSQTLQTKIKAIDEGRQKVKSLASDPNVALTRKKLEMIQQQLKEMSRQMVSSKQMLEQLRGVFSRDPDIKFSHIQNLGSAPFSLESPGQEPNKKATESTQNVAVSPFFKHDFVITFETNYFSTQHYIEQLQKLPGQLYFDSIDYEVEKYPIATVTLKVHTIGMDEGLMDA
ncbi:MAG TPA: hypothetical protein VGV92_07895 [Gammaproteobacteria bacterium]|nr:hypothetical protein [Gammaproteobacteria bacterium]